MNAFDRARREIFAVLLMDYHRSPNALADYDDLKGRYPLHVSEELFDPIVSEIEHLLIFSRTFDGVSVRIHPRGYGDIFRELLTELSAETLQIDWKKEEILSDATNCDWFPLPQGWKWFQISAQVAGGTRVAPASDRLVRLDDNDPKVSEIRASLGELKQKIRTGNDLGSMSAEAAQAAHLEVERLEQAFQLQTARAGWLMGMASATLPWIGKEAAGAVVGALALAILALIGRFLGII